MSLAAFLRPDAGRGEEFQVNSYTTGPQGGPALATAPNGSFIVAWYSLGSAGSDQSGRSAQARRFAADGSPLEDQFQINEQTTDDQFVGDVAMLADGGFVVVWTSYAPVAPDLDLTGVWGRRFGPDGEPNGPEFLVNTYTTGTQRVPAVAVQDTGAFVVVWSSYGSPGNDSLSSSIQGQRFDAAGIPQGAQFQVNSYTRGRQPFADVAAGVGNQFAVVWQSYGSPGTDTSFNSIQARLYDGPTPLDDQFQVNTDTLGSQLLPVVSTLGSEGFVIAWGDPEGAPGNDIRARRYAATGAPLSDEIEVNQFTSIEVGSPAVLGRGTDEFLVVWEGGTDGAGHSIQARAFDGQGFPATGELQMNAYTLGEQRQPAIAGTSGGGLVIGWQSFGSPGDDLDESIQALVVGLLFADGFESGSTARWSGFDARRWSVVEP